VLNPTAPASSRAGCARTHVPLSMCIVPRVDTIHTAYPKTTHNGRTTSGQLAAHLQRRTFNGASVECSIRSRPTRQRGWAHCCHICTGTGPLAPTRPMRLCRCRRSTRRGVRHRRQWSTRPHLHRDWAHPSPHLRRDWTHPCHICAGTRLTPAHICTGTQVLGLAGT
jgi:hypothetical protein